MEGYHSGLETKKREKQEQWDSVSEQIESIVDGRGKHIDEGVREPVVAMNVNGFSTRQSCEGHLDRGCPYPWVDFASPLADKIRYSDERFADLWKEHVKEMKGEELMEDGERMELQELINTITEANKETYLELSELIGEFNSLDDRKVNLEIRARGMGSGRVQPAGMPIGRYEDAMKDFSKLSKEELEHNLKEYGEEMNSFTELLRNRFFEE